MPTGYTTYILEDKLAKPSDFAKICARAFGACINQRDDSLEVPLEIPIPDTKYHDDSLKEANKKFKKLKSYNDEQKFKFGEKLKIKEISYNKKKIKEVIKIRAKLEKVLNWVNNWTPPTSDHHGLKKFMIEQINSTINFDGNPDYHESQLKAAIDKTSLDFYQKEYERAEWNVNYHKEEKEKEINRTNERANWIKSLIDSL
jgi:hypothetical protein